MNGETNHTARRTAPYTTRFEATNQTESLGQRQPRSLFANRSVIRTFGLLVTLPLGLAVVEILFADFLPETVISVLELPFMIFVYLPIAVIGTFILEPLGIPELLDTIPFSAEIMLLAALMSFYYLLTVSVLSLISAVRRATGG